MHCKGLRKLGKSWSSWASFPLWVTLASRQGKSLEKTSSDQNWPPNSRAVIPRRKAVTGVIKEKAENEMKELTRGIHGVLCFSAIIGGSGWSRDSHLWLPSRRKNIGTQLWEGHWCPKVLPTCMGLSSPLVLC